MCVPPPPLPESAISGDVNVFTSCVCQLDPTQTHTRDCVNRWCKRGQKGQYFQTEYVISNRCGGKEMVMNKERRAAEKGVRAARSREVGRELIAPTMRRSTGGENGRDLSATAIVPSNTSAAAWPGPRETAGVTSLLPFHPLHRLVSSSTSESPTQRCLACQHPKSCAHPLLQLGQRQARRTRD